MSVDMEDSGDGDGEEDGEDGVDLPVVATAAVMAAVAGGITAYALMNFGMGGSAGGFVVVGGLTLAYLYSKDTPHAAAGTGSYITAVLLIFTPTALYLPDILAGDISLFAEGIEGENVTIGGDVIFQAGAFSVDSLAGGQVEGIIGLVVWTVIFMVIALVLLVAGKIVKSMAPETQRNPSVRR